MQPTDRGVLLMTYGSPAGPDDLPRYLRAVRGGREPAPETVDEFRRRYAVIGGSPLVDVTRAQASALEAELRDGTHVRAAMRFSAPWLGDELASLVALGVREVVGIVLSPQISPLLMGGYERELRAAADALAEAAPRVAVAGAWGTDPDFVAAVAERLGEALAHLPANERDRAPILLTAHSLPRRIAESEPGYLGQLEDTARAIAAASGVTDDRWTFCWQSAGHEPGEWMRPDFADLMPELAAAGHRSVVVAPVQFLADHLETLYDIDVAARAQAEESGLRFVRAPSLGTNPRFIRALASVAHRAFADSAGPTPDQVAAGHERVELGT